MKKPPTLKDFAKATKKHAGGQRSPLDDNPQARADTIAFGKIKLAGKTAASWNQFATWLKDAHGISLRGNSLCQWCHNRRALHG